MSGLQPTLVGVFTAAGLTWLAVSAYAVGNRALFDRRRRSIGRALEPLELDALSRIPLAERTNTAQALLAALPRCAIEETAADTAARPLLAEALAAMALHGRGERRLVRAAAAHRGERGKWRRISALRVLARAEHPEGLPLLDRALRDPDPDVLDAAVAILGEIGNEQAARTLVEALRAGAYSRSRIAAQLDRFRLPILDLVRPLLGDADPKVRFWGAALAARYRGAPGLDDDVSRLAADLDASVRAAAVETLGAIGGPAALPACVRLLADPEWFVSAHAARAVGELRGVEAAERVAALLAHGQWWVRAAAKEALVSMGEAASQAVIPVLDHPDRFARNGAAEVLQNMGVIEEMIHGADVAQRHALLEKIFAAGGVRLVAATLERADPARPETVGRLRALGRRALEEATTA